MKAYRGKRGIAPLINFNTRRNLMVNFTSWPLCPQERTSCPLNTRLGEPQRIKNIKIKKKKEN
jgi:hypothetical protein